MNNKKIFQRHEIKYLLTIEQFNNIQKLMELYMNKEEYFNSSIRNIYYDTPNYYLIRNSIEKPEYKEKIRIRAYKTVKEDENVFVEVKKKYKNVVFKRREIIPYQKVKLFLDEHIMPNDTQITKEIDYTVKYYKDLKPAIFLAYNRLAYIGKEDENLRITFDRNIICRDYDIDLTKEIYGEYLLDENIVLMEVKTLMGLPRWLLDFLGENKIYKQSFSKYGNVYLKILKKEFAEERKYA